jgi:hypothetical protein
MYFLNIRLIHAWAVYAYDAPWDLLNGGAISYETRHAADYRRG